MIPYLMIIAGIVFALLGSAVLIAIAFLPFYHEMQIVFKRKDDYVFYETAEGKSLLNRKTKHVAMEALISILFGITLFFFGIYLGFAAKGEGFWFYRKIFGGTRQEDHWDQIDEEGRYVSSDGNVYTYYILVSGKEYSFRGEKCADYDDLKEKLSDIRRENEVVLIDSYAVSAKYRQAENLLKELGIRYKKEER